MHHSPAVIPLDEGFESFCAHAIVDPKTHGAPITIGFGHTGPDVRLGMVWTRAKAEAVLNLDLAMADAGVTHLIGAAPATQPQFDALVSIVFNVGAGKLHGSELIRDHVAGRYGACADQFLRWISPGSDVERGLLRRRRAERALYLSHGA